jgi:acetoacetate decarboxylase
MHEKDVLKRAFAMPLNDPAYPRGCYKFYNREFVVTHLPHPHRQTARIGVSGDYGAAKR